MKMTETDRPEAVPVLAGRGSFRALVQRIWRVVDVLTLVVVAISSGSLPAGAARIRPLHDRVLAEPQIVEARNTAGVAVRILFMASIEVDPHGVPHGVIRIDAGDGEPSVFGPVEALVGRGENQEARELLIFVTPRIVGPSMDTSMVHVEHDLVDADLLHWILSDRAGNQLIFSACGIIETLPPANGPPVRE
jgi:ABC-type cobalamin transport system permease subunit